ncbi:alpha/beta hydrolase [Seongchinamella sediminis]|uniref:alpha/beta hydrolase n=1 Tax=Seongchinamella sediminis TaxID=2283635 RepID=UPI0013C2B8EF|nr:alpha/beta hydrolase [Seongchinamella sediminis]
MGPGQRRAGQRRVTPEQLRQLRASLPSFAEPAPNTALLTDYLQFYHLDFSANYPDARHDCGTVPSAGERLFVHRWLQPGARANLLLVHGYFDHSGIYDKLVEYGLSRGCNVLIFDLPGHGLSSGERASVDDFADYGRAVHDVMRSVPMPALPFFALGQSTGCAALMELARHHPWPFARVALLAPLVRPAGWRGVQLGHSLLRRFTDSLERKFKRNTSDSGFLDFLRNDPLQSQRMSLPWIGALRRWLKSLPIADLGVGPALVVQGRRDATVGWRYNMKAILRLFPGSEIHFLPEAGHQLANESAAIRADYAAALDRYYFS